MARFQVNRLVVGLLAVVGCNVVVSAQDPDRTLLNQAIHCLTTKNFLKATDKPFSAGHFLTKKWYPDEQVLYVVIYGDALHTRGSVFTLFITGTADHRTLSIQNNGEFVRSRGQSADFKKEGVSF